MHDLDRTQLEFGESEYGEITAGRAGAFGSLELEGEIASPVNEAQETELAAELVGVASEEELEHFLGDLYSAATQAASQFARSETGQALGGILKDAATQALPVVGRAIGGWVAPGGGDAGAQIASTAGQMLGLELEGLSAEDRDVEAARKFVRFASAASKAASSAPKSGPPLAVAQAAARAAARRHAPGLVETLRLSEPLDGRRPHSGRWIRRGKTIVLIGL